jgi:hypothetical protein
MLWSPRSFPCSRFTFDEEVTENLIAVIQKLLSMPFIHPDENWKEQYYIYFYESQKPSN